MQKMMNPNLDPRRSQRKDTTFSCSLRSPRSLRFNLLGLSFITCATAFAAAQDITNIRDRQADVKQDTEQLARRIGTMLRVMNHYKLDQAGEAKLLDEAATTLRGLSKGQMTEVLTQLDAAMKAADAETQQRQVDAAYTGHREALTKLKNLLGHYDAIRDLDTAIARLERLARDEVELMFRLADILQDSLDTSSSDPARRRRALRSDFPTTRARREAEEQGDYFKDLAALLRQFEALKPNLRADQSQRMANALSVFVARDMLGYVRQITNRIRPEGTPENRHRDWAAAVDGVWNVAGQLQEAAQILKSPRDKLMVLKESRHKLVALQDMIQQEAKAGVEFFSNPPEAVPDQPQRIGFGMRLNKNQPGEDPIAGKSRTLADTEGRIAHDVRAVGYAIAMAAPVPAADVDRAVKWLVLAGHAFRQTAPITARLCQAGAELYLNQAIAGIDAAIAQTEKERTDALTATQVAAERIDQLIREQKKLKAETERTANDNDPQANRQQAQQQQRLTQEAAEVAQMPVPTTPRTKELLKESAQAMDAATKKLDQQQPKSATEKQDEAIARLEEAKKELTEKSKEIAQRRDATAQLEDAKRRLEDLAKAEQQIAKDAEKAAGLEKPESVKNIEAQKPDRPMPANDTKEIAKNTDPANAEKQPQSAQNKDVKKPESAQLPDKLPDGLKPDVEQLAKQQEKLTPQTRELAKELDQPVPDAAKLAEEAAKNMDLAKADLEKKKPNEAMKNADQAAKDLEKAAELVNQELADKLLKELADQARLNPEQIDALMAAREVAKAMEANEEAQRSSEQAMKNPAMKDLADRQAKVAEQAKQMDMEKAAEQAKNAAERLQKGDLQDALEQQQQALKQMQKAPQQSPEQGQLTNEQKALMEATKELAKSQEMTQMAREALQQAMAQSPEALQKQLEKAAEQLQNAEQQLREGQPQQANRSQNNAQDQLEQALQALQQTAAMNPPNQPPRQPGQDGQPNQELPGDQPNPNQQRPNEQRDNQNATGDRVADGKVNNPKAQLTNADGDGSFLHLPPRQRELIRQAMADKLPPDYASLIQQYYVNVAKSKPAVKPAAEPGRP
jgi:hypothetical protein